MITRDDWLKALEEAADAPLPETDALSLQELTAIFGVGLAATERRIHRLIAAGAAEETTKPIRMKNGGLRTVAAYRLLRNEVSDAQQTRRADER